MGIVLGFRTAQRLRTQTTWDVAFKMVVSGFELVIDDDGNDCGCTGLMQAVAVTEFWYDVVDKGDDDVGDCT